MHREKQIVLPNLQIELRTHLWQILTVETNNAIKKT